MNAHSMGSTSQQHQQLQPPCPPFPWLPPPLQTALQETQNAVSNLAAKLQRKLNYHQKDFSLKQQPEPVVLTAPDLVTLTLERQLKAWKENNAWMDEPPITKVSVPRGTLCHLDSTFKLGMPPDAVFNIITDPDNKRVFKNIKEVTYRKVIEDEGDRQLVEVEQAAMWRFLWLSGIILVRVLVDQDRRNFTVKYRLAREGFMRKFEGSWEIKPLYVDAAHSPLPPSNMNDLNYTVGRVASEVHLQQLVQPVFVPPPPISWYIRGITTKTTEWLIEDLQAEVKRIRDGEFEHDDTTKGQQDSLDSAKGMQNGPFLKRESQQRDQFVRLSSRKRRKSRWRVGSLSKSV